MASKRLPFGLRAALVLAAVLVVLDQTTKLLVRKYLALNQDMIPIIPKFFNLVHVENRGAAWGMMQNQTLFLSLVAIVMLILILACRRWIFEETRLHYVIYGLLVSGIIGNLIDRLKTGAVTDFLDFHIGTRHFPAFNVADSAICIAVFLYIVTTWKKPDRPPHPVDEKA